MDDKKIKNSTSIEKSDTPKKSVSITFEDLQNNKIIESSPDDLANDNIWNEKFFPMVYMGDKKDIDTDNQDILKEKYISWHKELLGSIINPENKLFYRTNFTNAMNIMHVHPFLTKKDKKNLDLLLSQINTSYRKQYVFNCIFGFPIILMYFKSRYRELKLKQLIRRHRFRIIFYNMMIFLIFDIIFNSITKVQLLNKYSHEYNLTEKYIDGYI